MRAHALTLGFTAGLVGLLWVAACGSEAPTQPDPQPDPVPNPAPTCAPGPSAGAPQGQIAFPLVTEYDSTDGDVAIPVFRSDLYLMNADGTGQVQLFEHGAAPAWSPDGSRLAFDVTRLDSLRHDFLGDIYVANADGSGRMQLTHAAFGPDTAQFNHEPAWSPDGRLIAFNRGQIYTMNTDGSDVTRLTTTASYGGPAWSPDGRRIAFSVYPAADLWVMAADGSEQVPLTTGSHGDFLPAWSPDGRCIAFERGWDIYLLNVETGVVGQLTAHSSLNGAPAWSPDGSYIAFLSDRAHPAHPATRIYWDIYIMGADGSSPVRVTDSPGNVGRPAWRPG